MVSSCALRRPISCYSVDPPRALLKANLFSFLSGFCVPVCRCIDGGQLFARAKFVDPLRFFVKSAFEEEVLCCKNQPRIGDADPPQAFTKSGSNSRAAPQYDLLVARSHCLSRVRTSPWGKVKCPRDFRFVVTPFVFLDTNEMALNAFDSSKQSERSNKFQLIHYQLFLSVIGPSLTKRRVDFPSSSNFCLNMKTNKRRPTFNPTHPD